MELFYQKNLKNDWVLIGQMKPKIVKIKQRVNVNKYHSKFINAMDNVSIPKQKKKLKLIEFKLIL